MGDIYKAIKGIIEKVKIPENEVHYGNDEIIERFIQPENISVIDTRCLPGVSTSAVKEFLCDELHKCDYFKRYPVTIIDKEGRVINIAREKIIENKISENEVEYTYDGTIVQRKSDKNKYIYLRHEGLKNALLIEYEKAYGGQEKYRGKLAYGRDSLIEFATQGFISIWPLSPSNCPNYYGPGQDLISESRMIINYPFNPTEKQLKKVRELASIMVYNPIIRDIKTSKMNAQGIQENYSQYKSENKKAPKELLLEIDEQLELIHDC